MNNHPTKYKGDLAVARVAVDLTEKKWFVLSPIYAEHLAFDLLAYKLVKGKPRYIRVQVKSSPKFGLTTVWKNHTKIVEKSSYSSQTIDFFASYIEEQSCVVYVSVKLLENLKRTSSVSMRYELPDSPNSFWWYEDFLDISTSRKHKRKLSDFGAVATASLNGKRATDANSRYGDLSNLQKKVWKFTLRDIAPKYEVSDVALRKYCISRNILLPPTGYFVMSEENKKNVRLNYKTQYLASLKVLVNTRSPVG